MNQFSQLDAQNEMSRLAQMQSDEMPESPDFVLIDEVDCYLESIGQ
jgi:hypothetical protein